MKNPLVSVICLNYNHAAYIREAIESVLSQTYQPVELIIVDDNSQDNSREIIEDIAGNNRNIQCILADKNLGNCAAFNQGFRLSKGNFIIDLAADDLLLPERIAAGMHCFEHYGADYGVNFTDALYIDQNGKKIRSHYPRDGRGNLIDTVPQGYIYKDLLARYFICAPTMMIRRSVLEKLQGYDESLAYEDFDFWIRSSRIFKYCFTNQMLVRKRILSGSLSSGQYKPDSRILDSTWQVCMKAEKLNETDEERKSLLNRCRYEFRKALFSGNFSTAGKFAAMIQRNDRNWYRSIPFKLLHKILK